MPRKNLAEETYGFSLPLPLIKKEGVRGNHGFPLNFVSEKIHVEKEKKKFQSPLEKPKKVKREKSISYV